MSGRSTPDAAGPSSGSDEPPAGSDRRRRVAAVLLPDTATTYAVDTLRRSLGVPEPFSIPAHLTLVGPREIAEEDLAALHRHVHDTAAAVSPFTVELGPFSTFSPDSPTLHLAARSFEVRDRVGDREDPLVALRGALNTGVLAGSDPWEFVPHVTLAHPCPCPRVEAVLEVLDGARWHFEARSVHLLEQRGGDGGTHWEAFAEAPFGAPGQVVLEDGAPLSVYERSLLDVGCHDLASALPVADDDRPVLCVSIEGEGDRGGAPVAVAHGRVGTLAELQGVVVDAAWQGRGLGSAVVERWLAAARARGAEAVLSRPTSSGAASWLSSRGFVDAGWPWLRAR